MTQKDFVFFNVLLGILLIIVQEIVQLTALLILIILLIGLARLVFHYAHGHQRQIIMQIIKQEHVCKNAPMEL